VILRQLLDATVAKEVGAGVPDVAERNSVALDDQAFRKAFAGSPIKRTKRRGLARNAAVVLGNQRSAAARPALEHAADSDPEPVVRDAATWAIERLDAAD